MDLVVGEVFQKVLSVSGSDGILCGHMVCCEVLWAGPLGVENVHQLFGGQVALLGFVQMEIVFQFGGAILRQLVFS